MGYTQDKHVPGSNLFWGGAQMRHQGAVRRLDLLHLRTWGFGHPVSGSPELPRPWGWQCLFIQASPAHAAGTHADPTACRESPMPLRREGMAPHFALCLRSGFLPAHPDVLPQRRWLAGLHQCRVCRRKAPAPAVGYATLV